MGYKLSYLIKEYHRYDAPIYGGSRGCSHSHHGDWGKAEREMEQMIFDGWYISKTLYDSSHNSLMIIYEKEEA